MQKIAILAASLLLGGICNLHAEDYSFMWWMHGLRDPRGVFAIQTSRYAVAFDSVGFRLTHLTAAAAAGSAEEALGQANREVFGESNAAMACVLEADGKRFRVLRGGKRREDCQLIESGRLFQRRLLGKLQWTPDAPIAGSEFEIAAWPDRLLLLLRITAARPIDGAVLRIDLKLDDHRRLVALPVAADVALDYDRQAGTFTVRTSPERIAKGEEKTIAVVLCPVADNGKPAFETIRRNETEPLGIGSSGKSGEGAMGGLSALAEPSKDKGGQAAHGTPIGRVSRKNLRVAAVQIVPARVDLDVRYDPTMGWHQVRLRNDGAARDYSRAGNDRIERVKLTIENPTPGPRTVRLNFCKGKGPYGEKLPDQRVFGITGISAMLRDRQGNPMGVPVQISKNWHTEGNDRYRGPWYRGLTMLDVPATTTLELEYTSVNAHFGGVAAASHAQLCLVGWPGGQQLWDQAAIGAWGESLCFEPDHAQRGGSVLDTRPLMVTNMRSDGGRWGWTNNVGGADFLRGKRHARMKCLVRRNGPVLTETTYAGRSADATIDLRYTVSLYRTDDLTRGIYQFRYDVRRPTDFERLVWFQCGGDDYSYTGERKMAAGNERGLLREWNTQWGGNTYRTEPVEVAGRVPWFSMHEAVPRGKGAWANRGLVLRRWDARIGGRPVRPWAAERGARVRGVDTSLIDILPPPGTKRLQPGDYVEAVVEHVIVPQFARDYYGPNENLRRALQKHENTWRMMYREALGNDLRIETIRGKLVRTRPLLIRAEADRAEFSVAGGLGYGPITVAGLSDFRRPVLEMRDAGGTWKRIDQSVHGRDYWQTDFDPAGRTWQISYTVLLDTPDDRPRKREFRFHLEKQ